MYLDPGSAGLVVQAIFAAIAAVFAFFGRSRTWVAAVWSRTVAKISSFWRRPGS